MTLSRRRFLATATAATAATAAIAATGGLDSAVAQALPGALAANPAAWMADLPDSLSLLQMTIPGTHDTACTNPKNGTEWSHTQNWGIPEQLRRGIRFLDIRCNGLQDHMGDSFGIYHSGYYQYITFDEVLNQSRDFLGANPREVLVMRVKKENGTKNDVGNNFSNVFNGYLDKKGYRPLFRLDNQFPTLGQARGKIVLIADFANDLNVLQWPPGDNGNLSNDRLYVQDRYEGVSTNRKYDYIRDCFNLAAGDQNNARLYINFTSFANGVWPKNNAAAIMPNVFHYLDDRKNQKQHLGIVPMDFPDFHTNVLQLLIDKNFV